jgi:hypothetical protein
METRMSRAKRDDAGEERQRSFVRLAVRYNKNHKDRDQPIPQALSRQLKEWLDGKASDEPLWPLLPHANLALRLRRDLQVARKAWIDDAATDVEREERQKSHTLKYTFNDGAKKVWADFHALRHTRASPSLCGPKVFGWGKRGLITPRRSSRPAMRICATAIWPRQQSPSPT